MAERENSTVEVRPSKIGGLGVFALNGFRAGEVIREFAVEREITRADPLRAGEKPEHAFLSDQTRLVFVGDYVDRGPDSAGVIEYLKRKPVVEVLPE